MNAGEFREWMKRAFLFVESALSMEIATPSRICMTEEYLRSSLVRGLSYSKPEAASRVVTELPATWTKEKCWNDPTHDLPTGRPIQHDVAVLPDDSHDNGLVCEVKWLKQAKAKEVAKDVWKLALSRSTKSEGHALRTYLLLGGEGDALSDTLQTLRKNRIVLRWSNAGRQGGTPHPRVVPLHRFLARPLGEQALQSQLSWGTKPRHFRTPPACWATLRVSVRETWLRTVGTARWRVILWEFDHRGSDENDKIDWNSQRQGWPFAC